MSEYGVELNGINLNGYLVPFCMESLTGIRMTEFSNGIYYMSLGVQPVGVIPAIKVHNANSIYGARFGLAYGENGEVTIISSATTEPVISVRIYKFSPPALTGGYGMVSYGNNGDVSWAAPLIPAIGTESRPFVNGMIHQVQLSERFFSLLRCCLYKELSSIVSDDDDPTIGSDVYYYDHIGSWIEIYGDKIKTVVRGVFSERDPINHLISNLNGMNLGSPGVLFIFR